MIHLRCLEEKDAEYMLEWMKDDSLNQFFRFDEKSINQKSVQEYILKSQEDSSNKHCAVVNENDEYLGTISLKNIDFENLNAEYAISLRQCAIGTGIAKEATLLVLQIAFEELNLEKVYLNVYEDNKRARRFYEKNGFQYEGCFVRHLKKGDIFKNLCWYAFFRRDFIAK